jgi:hypothetical protein
MSKPYDERVKEVVRVLSELRDYGIPSDTAGYDAIKEKMTEYVKTGEPWVGKIPMPELNRVAYLILPRRTRDTIQLTLKST